MPDLNKQHLETILNQFADEFVQLTLGEAGAQLDVSVEPSTGNAGVRITLGFPTARHRYRLARALEAHLREVLPALNDLDIEVHDDVRSHAVQSNLKPIGAVSNIIAVASAKGGVGKSTTAANLALALASEGARVGLLDADIYGPSQPRMLGLRGRQPTSPDGKHLDPLRAHGIVAMSIGFLVDEAQPMVWRGPMVTQALNQLIADTNWGELDYLLVDMPPGTGDTQLTMGQRVPLSGAIIVTTPQDIALMDARKGLKMFEKINVNVLGVVENMSTHVCSNCGHEEHIFGAGGGASLAEESHVPFLGSLPLDIRIREQADGGAPTVIADPDGALAEDYRRVALRAAARLSAAPRDYSRRFPNIVVE
jgi:ATP-binding protein involved in chromosome partitioning